MGFFASYGTARNALNDIGEQELRNQRQVVEDEAAKMNRFREEGRRQAAMQTPTFVPGGEIKTVADAAVGKPGIQTGGGAGYVPRKTGKVTDRTVEVSEAANRLAAAKRMAEAKPQIQFSRMVEQDGKLTHIPAADNRGKSSGAVSPQQIGALQSRLTDLQSQEVARQRGREQAPTQGVNQYDKPTPYDPLINQAAQQAGINPTMFKRLIGSESSFNPNAASPRGEQYGYGIAQIAAVHGLSKEQMANPAVALPFAAQLFAKYLKESGGDEREAVMRYKGAVSEQGRAAMGQVYDSKIGGTQQPQATTTAPQAAPLSQQTLGPGPAAGPNLLIQQEMARIKNMMQYGKDASAVEQYNQLYRSMQFADIEQRAGQDPQTLANLALNVGAQVYQNGQGFFRVARNSSGQMVPMEPPMTSTMMASKLREMADPVYKLALDQSRAKLNFELQKAQAEIQKAQIEGDYKLADRAMQNANAIQLKLAELGQPKVAVDSAQGGAYVTRGGEVSYMRPGIDTKLGQSGATTQAVQ